MPPWMTKIQLHLKLAEVFHVCPSWSKLWKSVSQTNLATPKNITHQAPRTLILLGYSSSKALLSSWHHQYQSSTNLSLYNSLLCQHTEVVHHDHIPTVHLTSIIYLTCKKWNRSLAIHSGRGAPCCIDSVAYIGFCFSLPKQNMFCNLSKSKGIIIFMLAFRC